MPVNPIDKIRYEIITQKDGDDVLIPIPPELLKRLGWKEGDNISIGQDEQGRYILKRTDK